MDDGVGGFTPIVIVVTDVQPMIDHCFERGIDLSGMTTVGTYNGEVDEPYRLTGPDDRMVVVLGNTRAIWPHVRPGVVAGDPDPVDTHVETVVGEAIAPLADKVIDVRFSHQPPPRRIAIQRLAHVAGLAWLSPSHLCIHPEYGPWMALRAAVVLDLPGEPTRPIPPPCDCSANCHPVLETALAAGAPANQADLRERWRLWLAVRDACPVGREHRYAEEQILYHYIGVRP